MHQTTTRKSVSHKSFAYQCLSNSQNCINAASRVRLPITLKPIIKSGSCLKSDKAALLKCDLLGYRELEAGTSKKKSHNEEERSTAFILTPTTVKYIVSVALKE